MTTTCLVLLVLYQVKHFVADYPMQGKYMLQKFRADWGFFLPLLAHASTHGYFTFLIGIAFTLDFKLAMLLGLFDMTVHFIMDRIKAGPKYLGRFKPLSAHDFRTISPYPDLFSSLHGKLEKNSDLIKGNTYFWWSLGLDQAVHHLTHYAIIAVILGVI